MGAAITLAGESLKAQKQGAQQVLDIARFVFANVPGLDPNTEVDRSAGKPPAAQIVHTATIAPDNKGYVNPNQVVYSVMLGSDVGDWDFNWVGLESAEGVLFAVSYVPLQQKRRNIQPLQIGNNLTRNFLLEFDGALELTGITIDASTWQYDFTARLKGIDERERLSNRDIYGRACFLGNALQLEKSGSAYQLKPGIAYLEGIRIESGAAFPMTMPALPTTVWVDIALQRQMNDVVATWAVVYGTGKTDYIDSSGVPHYCIPIAQVSSAGVITDQRSTVLLDTPLIHELAGKLGKNSNAVSASKLATARTISATGAATGSASFDGSANTAIALTLANSGAVAGTYPKVTINAKGLVTSGAALVAADIPSLDAGKISSGTLAAARIPTLNQNTTGNAATATKLATAITINGVSVNAGSNVTISAAATATSVMAAIAAAPLGSVGSYALCKGLSGVYEPGSTVAGSNLEYATTEGNTATSPKPAGTWRVMGRLSGMNTRTLFLRIA
ncbi:phage tail-collar fiber domain-containing protein [Pseudomonas sp. B392_1p]|uniref:phage tail-collar fiber domain-containing protein n=1 Tax=Pseudomonas sp. B392_1p TaxID=3457507 RepID=UPI003FD61D48